MDTLFFTNPTDDMQRKYEALRASFIDGLTDHEVAEKFGFSFFAFKTIKRDLKNIEPDYFFKSLQAGRPKGLSEKSLSAKDRIIQLRKKNYSVIEIKEKLVLEKIDLSENQIGKILDEEGFTKLFRRTFTERLEILQKDTIYPQKSDIKDFPTSGEFLTNFGGIFLFLPLLGQLKLPELFNNQEFYGSSMIPRQNYLLSYLALKLLGKERLSHVDDLGFDIGLGIFAGLNVLPKSTAMSSYSYRNTHHVIKTMLTGFNKTLYNNGFVKGKNINLDFHRIPFFGEDPTKETNWIPVRNKRMDSILSFFAQDLDTTFLTFSDADIKNKDASDEIITFVDFYKESTGLLPERLIFDSKLTTYKNLSKLNQMGIKFITLARRGKNFADYVSTLSGWKSVRLDAINREYKNLKYHCSPCKITDYKGDLNEIIVTGNGRELPMKLITNDFEDTVKNILTTYTRRWRIENNIQENVDFFSLNAIASPVIVQVDFDIAMTLIANTLYKIFAQKTKWLDHAKPKTIARQVIDTKAKVQIDENNITIKFTNRTYNPVIKDWTEQVQNILIPWWQNKKLVFKFE
jgi:hypothetical protein